MCGHGLNVVLNMCIKCLFMKTCDYSNLASPFYTTFPLVLTTLVCSDRSSGVMTSSFHPAHMSLYLD